MSDLTLLAPQSSYFSLLNTQSQNGLTNILQVIQDGLGRNTPLSLSQIGLDINTTMGGGFSINNTQLIATAPQINAVCSNASFAAFTTELKLPNGTTDQRSGTPTNGDIRYNSTIQAGELYAAGAWMTINAGNPSGYYPGGPTYIQDTYLGGTFNVCIGTPAQVVTNRTECTLFGDSVVQTDSSGSHLCAFGYQALMVNSSGPDNCAFGHMSGKSTIAGVGNSYFGKSAGQSNITSNGISAFGYMSLANATDGYNSAFGYHSGLAHTTGQYNVFFGAFSGETGTIANLTGCTLFGALTTISTGLTNATAIGYQASATTSNTIILGSPGTNIGIGTSSPLFPLHVIGFSAFQGITSGFTGTGVIKTQIGRLTSDVTPTNIDFSLPTSLPNILDINLRISVINTIGNKSAYSVSNASAFYNGSTTASTGTLPTITMTATTAYTPTAVWSISGNNLRLTLTGVSGSNEIWVASVEAFSTFNTSA